MPCSVRSPVGDAIESVIDATDSSSTRDRRARREHEALGRAYVPRNLLGPKGGSVAIRLSEIQDSARLSELYERGAFVARSRTPGNFSLAIRGADRSRTGDLRLAKPALSQLSYGPCSAPSETGCWVFAAAGYADLVGQGRVELPTSRLSGVRSNHLSYWPSCGR
jgi:hypothetical protein